MPYADTPFSELIMICLTACLFCGRSLLSGRSLYGSLFGYNGGSLLGLLLGGSILCHHLDGNLAGHLLVEVYQCHVPCTMEVDYVRVVQKK